MCGSLLMPASQKGRWWRNENQNYIEVGDKKMMLKQ